MMFSKKQADSDFVSKNGFTFKRKRQDYSTNDYPLQQVRKEEDQIVKSKQPPIQINLKASAPAKDQKQRPPQDENVVPNSKKVVQNTRKGKESLSKKPMLKEKGRYSNDDGDDEPEEEIRLVKGSALDDSPLSKGMENISNAIERLPPYPDYFNPLDFDMDMYEKENPYKRLGKMVTEICAKEESMLKDDFKNYGFFLKMLGKFVNRVNYEVDKKLDANLKDRSCGKKIMKENLQNVFELQKKKVIEKLIKEYSKRNEVLNDFQENAVNKGKLLDTVESYEKYMKNDDKLFLDGALSKRIELQRDELDRKLTQKIKASTHELLSHEKQLSGIHKDMDKLTLKLEQQNKQAYNKVFKEYIPIFETDPADVMKNFLAM